jgi:hypothetical protein
LYKPPRIGGPTLAVEVIQTMTTTTGKASGSFTIKAWDEQPWAEVEEAPKLTHARVTTVYTGDLAGLQGEGGYVARRDEPAVAWELRWSLG